MSEEADDPDAHLGYERRDVRGRFVAIVAVSSIGATIVLLGMVTLLIRVGWQVAEVDSDAVEAMEIAPVGEPALQEAPWRDWQTLHAERARRLESYGWVNRDANIAHIPIEEAMRLTVERAERRRSAGLP